MAVVFIVTCYKINKISINFKRLWIFKSPVLFKKVTIWIHILVKIYFEIYGFNIYVGY